MVYNRKVILFFSIFAILFFALFIFFVKAQNNTLTVEANIVLEPTGAGTTNESFVSIAIIPDYISLGNATIGKLSNESKVVINNTGNVKVKVTSQLTNENDEVFRYLQIAEGSSFKNVSIFNTNVTTKKTLSVRLDLRNFDGNIEEDQIGRQAQVQFLAMQA